MNRDKLANEIHQLLGEPLDKWKNPSLGIKIMKDIFTIIAEALHRGEEVHIKGFGIFRVREKKLRPTPNNFVTSYGKSRPGVCAKERRTYPPRKYVIFQPSTALMAMINLPTGHTAPTCKERRTQRRWGVTHDN